MLIILSIIHSDSLFLSFQLTSSRTWLKEFSGPTGRNSLYPNPNPIWSFYSFIVFHSLLSLFPSLPNFHSMVLLHHLHYHHHPGHYLHHLTPLSLHPARLENPNCTNSTLHPYSWMWLEKKPYHATWSPFHFMTATLKWLLRASRQPYVLSLDYSFHGSSRWLCHSFSP